MIKKPTIFGLDVTGKEENTDTGSNKNKINSENKTTTQKIIKNNAPVNIGNTNIKHSDLDFSSDDILKYTKEIAELNFNVNKNIIKVRKCPECNKNRDSTIAEANNKISEFQEKDRRSCTDGTPFVTNHSFLIQKEADKIESANLFLGVPLCENKEHIRLIGEVSK